VVKAIAASSFDITEARLIISTAYLQALQTMSSMVGNAGQLSVYDSYVIPQFEAVKNTKITFGWPDVDIGEYMSFMGEIVGEGNQIMNEAYDEAQRILSEYEEIAESFI
jgi:hypothetical protein